MSETIAIYGITGALGREVLVALEVEHDGIGELVPVAGPRSAGETVRWRGGTLPIRGPAEVRPADVDIAVFATRPDVVVREAPRLVAAGARVIDASGSLAAPPLPSGLHAAAPLVWPKLGQAPAVDLEVASLVALPAAVTSTLAPVLEAVAAACAIHGAPPPAHCDVVALSGASAAGRTGIDALSRQAVGLLGSHVIIEPAPFEHVLAFNALTEAPTSAVVAEARLQAELAVLVPALAALRPSLVSLWIPTFTGLALVVTLRGPRPFDAGALAAVNAALEAHPDLRTSDPESPDDPDLNDEDEDDADRAADRRAEVAQGPLPDSMALRDSLDQDEVRVAPPTVTLDGALRLVLFADPLHRTAIVAQDIATRWARMADEDA